MDNSGRDVIHTNAGLNGNDVIHINAGLNGNDVIRANVSLNGSDVIHTNAGLNRSDIIHTNAGLNGSDVIHTNAGLNGNDLIHTNAGLNGRDVIHTNAGLNRNGLIHSNVGLNGSDVIHTQVGLKTRVTSFMVADILATDITRPTMAAHCHRGGVRASIPDRCRSNDPLIQVQTADLHYGGERHVTQCMRSRDVSSGLAQYDMLRDNNRINHSKCYYYL